MNKRKKGGETEEKTVEVAIKKGYTILEKNYFSRYGEIDIILEKNGVIVFLEVKYRSSDIYGTGGESINYKKKRRIYLSALEYIGKKSMDDLDFRFDAVIIENNSFDWIENCFWGDEFGF